MSEPIPEAIPTSADPRARRPLKRLRGENTAIVAQANEIENLMWDPDRPVEIPALSSEARSKLAPPPEIVTNVQGSSAGAGSGEFHVYKASRRRENERLAAMDEEAKKEVEDANWQQELEEKRKRDEEKTKKNRERRNKRKGKTGQPAKGSQQRDDNDGTVTKSVNAKKPLKVPQRAGADGDEDNNNNQSVQAQAQPHNGITIHDDD